MAGLPALPGAAPGYDISNFTFPITDTSIPSFADVLSPARGVTSGAAAAMMGAGGSGGGGGFGSGVSTAAIGGSGRTAGGGGTKKAAARRSTGDGTAAVGGAAGGDGTTPKRKRPPKAPQLDEHGNVIPPKKRKRKTEGGEGGAEVAGGSGGKRRAKAARNNAADAASASAAAAGGYVMPIAADGGISGGVNQYQHSPHRTTQQNVSIGRMPGPFFKELQSLLYALGDASPPLRETVCVLEECVLDFLATIVERMLAIPSVPVGSDALQVAREMAHSRDGSGLAATTLHTATPLRMDTLLFVLRENPHYFERVKHLWAAAQQQQEAEGAAKKAAAKAAKMAV